MWWVGQSVSLTWLTDMLPAGGKNQTTPGPGCVPGRPVPIDSNHSAAPSRQIHTRSYLPYKTSISPCFKAFIAISSHGEGMVFNHTSSMEEAVQSNCFFFFTTASNLHVFLSFLLNLLMNWQCVLNLGERFLSFSCCWLLFCLILVQIKKNSVLYGYWKDLLTVHLH